jgi:EpsI family protein
MRPILAWTPAALFALGAVFTVGVDLQQSLPLRMPLGSAVPQQLLGAVGTDVVLSEDEVRVAGVTEYLMRAYETPDTSGLAPGDPVDTLPRHSAPTGPRVSAALPFSVYVGYYDSQMQGKTIHSPKNCLPGAGWEALASTRVVLATPAGTVTVNRYLLQNGDAQALVLYWYQGRGRVESDEYLVKWDLLRDAVLRQRSDEALVRVVVPVRGDAEAALQRAVDVAGILLPAVYTALPS